MKLMNSIKERVGLRVLKSGFAIIFAIYLATFLGLEHASTAGIFGILSILDTKRKTLKVAVRRFISAILGLFLSGLLFALLGYEIYVIGIIVVVFLPVAKKFDLESGFIINMVLATQLLGFGEVTTPIMLNQLGLVIIGLTTGLLMNMHIPYREKEIIRKQQVIEEDLRIMLEIFGYSLRNACPIGQDMDERMKSLIKNIKEGLRLSYRYIDNRYLSSEHYYVQYMLMRKKQFRTLEAMRTSLKKKIMTQMFADALSKICMDLSKEIHTDNDGVEAMKKLEDVKEYYRQLPLPETRKCFEDRAHLFVFLHHLENFIRIKMEFYQENQKEKPREMQEGYDSKELMNQYTKTTKG
ncbi:aromatic acid exporter family protein [Isachenkonia alkalipeptolytica]|uniref:Aromatic acid exporter family protein n=1 Tax=Isachenkonia alkalipeptolytica TaxID=2565777 RepID=A0AA43XLZ2_9CLOT|nr:aromatic acid exporter family protein [Isachenkonia alkalipeptolytica]NBG89273.1 aromatic acid exporter family protein [Isachenkonia alkalipeptolytica]